MSKDNATTIRSWLILCLASFGLGTIVGGVTQRNVLKALTTGAAVSAPIMCVGGLLINSGPQTPDQLRPTPEILTPKPPSSTRVAIFWDYENVRHSDPTQITKLATAISDIAHSKGHCAKKMVYSNWKQEPQGVARALTSRGFDKIHVEMGKTNSVDVRLAVECIATAYENSDIRHFVLVTSDKDYISLVNKLQKLEREVIVVGSDRTSPVIIESADQFFSTSDVLPSNPEALPPAPKAPSPSPASHLSFEEGTKCLLQVLSRLSQRMSDTSGSHIVSLSQIDNMMRKESTFTYQGCTSVFQPGSQKSFSKFSHFIEAAAAKGLIQTYQHNARTSVSLVPLLTFDEAMQCVVYALWLDHQETQAKTYQDVNITYLHRLISQYLNFREFTPTKILFLRQDGNGRYATLSKFLNDVVNTKAIALRREANFIYVKLTAAPAEPNPPAELLTRLAQLQPHEHSQPTTPAQDADTDDQPDIETIPS